MVPHVCGPVRREAAAAADYLRSNALDVIHEVEAARYLGANALDVIYEKE
jgi:hypothetical protein